MPTGQAAAGQTNQCTKNRCEEKPLVGKDTANRAKTPYQRVTTSFCRSAAGHPHNAVAAMPRCFLVPPMADLRTDPPPSKVRMKNNFQISITGRLAAPARRLSVGDFVARKLPCRRSFLALPPPDGLTAVGVLVG